jgi:hypothetical protein
VTLPLSGFTDYWDDATGEAIKTCQENKIYCTVADGWAWLVHVQNGNGR